MFEFVKHFFIIYKCEMCFHIESSSSFSEFYIRSGICRRMVFLESILVSKHKIITVLFSFGTLFPENLVASI